MESEEVVEEFAVEFIADDVLESVVVVLLSIEELLEFAVEAVDVLFAWVVDAHNWQVLAELVVILVFL